MPRNLGSECGAYLAIKAQSDTALWVLDGDLADSDGAEYFMREFPQRFIAAGIAEQCMVSCAAGMAACGLRPWVFSFAAFLCYRAYDQIRVGVSQTALPVALIGSHAGGCGGRNGKTHVALNDIAVISSLPNIEIWAPADREDVVLAVDRVQAAASPAYLRMPRLPKAMVGGGEPREARWIGKPTPSAIVAYGSSTHWGLALQSHLANLGREVGLLHLNKIWPLHHALRHLEGVQRALVIEDHYAIGGLAALLRHTGFQATLHHAAWPSDWSGQSGSDADLLRFGGLDTATLAERFDALMPL